MKLISIRFCFHTGFREKGFFIGDFFFEGLIFSKLTPSQAKIYFYPQKLLTLNSTFQINLI